MDTPSRVALSPPTSAANHVVLGALLLSYSCLIFSLYMTAFQPLTHISPMILVATWIGALVFGVATYLADQRYRRYDTPPSA